MTDALRRDVCALHAQLPGNGLVAWTSGNLSALVVAHYALKVEDGFDVWRRGVVGISKLEAIGVPPTLEALTGGP